ncbi:ankyrin repeat-containing protein BDA1-like [Hibiscus syriacus]|uniref:ankyrin repeat-containing protein BDA1-like n=1 Tax=Hibiscus syriacus TaxID=106335 RepID=UPI0019214C7E|nr:ankyrin repeat-containing protein BDA1-like [Hibiscus syriacus]
MDESLKSAARMGNASDLYSLIQRNGNVLRHLDEVEFIDTPLHIAAEEGCTRFTMEMINPDTVENRRLDALQVLLRTLTKTAYHLEVVNRKDENGNTALHIAASSNEAQMLKLLLNCKADKRATDQAGLTALGVAQQHGYTESITVLRGCFIPVVSKFIPKLEKQTASYATKASSLIFRDMDNISGENRNALLVILGLLLTATYQATLSPPGGVWQGGNASKKLGTYVMDPSQFLLFYIPTYVVFIVTFFLTLALLKPFPYGFRTALQVLLAFLAVCFHQSITFIVPTSSASIILSLLSGIVFILMAFMCIAYQVSKFSVSIVGCWILPFHFSAAAIQVLFLCMISSGKAPL